MVRRQVESAAALALTIMCGVAMTPSQRREKRRNSRKAFDIKEEGGYIFLTCEAREE